MAGVPAAFQNMNLGRRPNQAGTGNLLLARTRPPPPGLSVGAGGNPVAAAFGAAMGAANSVGTGDAGAVANPVAAAFGAAMPMGAANGVGTGVGSLGPTSGMGMSNLGSMGSMAGMLGAGEASGVADPSSMFALAGMDMAAMAAMLNNMSGMPGMGALSNQGLLGNLPDMSSILPAASNVPAASNQHQQHSQMLQPARELDVAVAAAYQQQQAATLPTASNVPNASSMLPSPSAANAADMNSAAAISLHDIGMNASNPLEQQMHQAVREFVLKWELESSFLKRILLQLRHRPMTWVQDLTSLGEDMKEAKSPPGFLAMKLRQMADGTYVRKGHKLYQGPSGDEVLDEVRKFLDDVRMGDRVDFEKRLVMELKKRDDWKLDLEAIHEEIREAKSPPGLLNAKLHQMNEGIWARKGQKGKRRPTSDPMLVGIRAFLDKWDLEDGFEGRIRKQLLNRINTWREDLEDLSSEINELRYGKNSPAGYISAKLKEMDEGKFIPKRCLPPKKKVPPPPGGYAPANPSPEPDRKKSRSRERISQRYRSRSRDGGKEERRSRSRAERRRDRSRSYSQRRPKSRSRSPDASMSFREFRKQRQEKERDKEKDRGGRS